MVRTPKTLQKSGGLKARRRHHQEVCFALPASPLLAAACCTPRGHDSFFVVPHLIPYIFGRDFAFSGVGRSGSSLASGAQLKRILSYDQTLYEILGVDELATLDEIKKQYRRKVLEYHPDKAKNSSGGDAPSPCRSTANGESPRTAEHEAFLKIQEAYEALGGELYVLLGRFLM